MNKKQVFINVSNLSPLQKQQCVRFLNEKNIKFQKTNEEYTAKIVISQNQIPKQNNDHSFNKKLLAQTINIKSFPKIVELCKYIQIYIYPKRLSLKSLLDYTQGIIQSYFKTSYVQDFLKSSKTPAEYQSFTIFFYKQIAKKQKNKSKTQQLLVNIIESINHYKAKSKSIKIMHSFLSETYKIEQMLFLYFLRKMIQSIKGIKIYQKQRVKNDLNNLILEQQYVWSLLSNLCQSSQRQQLEFNKIKQIMKFDSKIRKNIVLAYDLIDFLLVNFKSFQKKTNISIPQQNQIQTQDSQNITKQLNSQSQKQQKVKFSPEENIIFLAALQALKKLCEKVSVPLKFYDRFSILISNLLFAIFRADKIYWFESIKMQPTDPKLHYIESLQRQYEQFNKCKDKSNLFINRFIKRVLQAPGFQQQYLQHILNLDKAN